jgi:selenocysteine lyase/cysteine desulfurase
MKLYKFINLTYDNPTIRTSINKKIKMIYADATATGQMSPIVDNYITKIAPYYGNVHSNAFCGIAMTSKINKVKEYIRKSLNLTDEDVIVFTGNGTTGAINHLIHCLDPKNYTEVNIILSEYEHHSNYLPWMELSKDYLNVKIHMIPLNETFTIDTNYIEKKLNELCKDDKCLTIVSLTACSNVTGIKTNFEPIFTLVGSYKNTYLCADFACLAPYDKIDVSKFGAIFFSPHKFIGGTSTPGILIAKKCLFMKQHPYAPGGGCVVSVTHKNIEYYADIEKKESGGTPNIIGIIRIKKILQIKDQLLDKIKHNEEEIFKYVSNKMEELMKKYDTFKMIFQSTEKNRLPIFCVSIKPLHHDFVVTLLNDLFGIQTRGGISCCGLLGEYIKKKYDVDGWCRITFHYTMNKKIIDIILLAIEYIIQNGKKISEIYTYDKTTDLFILRS